MPVVSFWLFMLWYFSLFCLVLQLPLLLSSLYRLPSPYARSGKDMSLFKQKSINLYNFCLSSSLNTQSP